MKASKKLLSLFLALVMIITSCSVGFTAFAADGNKSDTNNEYWADATDAEAAFSSLNDLADTYVPMLLNVDAIKNLLEGKLGMTITDKTTISDVVAGVSPLLLGLLGGSADKAAIRGDSSKMADFYYAYLDGSDKDTMDFYALYQFCSSNRGASGELGEYCSATYDKLNKLLNVYKDLNRSVSQKYSRATDKMTSTIMGALVSSLPMPPQLCTPEQLGEVKINGVAFKDYKDDDIDFLVEYIAATFKTIKVDYKCENPADAFYYTYGVGAADIAFQTYFTLAELGGEDGITLSLPNPTTGEMVVKHLTRKGYLNDLKEVYSLEFVTSFFKDNMGITLPSDPEELNKIYERALPYLVNNMALQNTPVTDIKEYKALCTGVLKYSGVLEDVDKTIKDAEITEAQLQDLIDYAAENWNGVVDIDNLIKYVSDDHFSEPASYVFQQYLGQNVNKPAMVPFVKAAVEGDMDALKNFRLNYGSSSRLNEMNLVDRINELIPSAICKITFGAPDSSELCAINPTSLFSGDLFRFNELIKPETSKYSYKYSDYSIPDSLIVEAVNSTLNNLLGQYLDPDTQVGKIVTPLIQALVETNVTLYENGEGVLKDIWLNLYNEPIETVFKLLPVLTVLIDELVVPILLHDDEDASFIDLGKILLDENPDATLNLYKYSQAAKSPIGIGQLYVDLNTALPAILHWLTGDYDTAYELVGSYAGAGEPYEIEGELQVPRFLNIYVADKAIHGAHIGTGSVKVPGLARTLYNKGLDKEVAIGIDEIVAELATFAMTAIDEYLAEHKNDTKYGLDTNGPAESVQKGLNNISVALPQLINQIGQDFIKKYNVKSDWTYTWDGKIANRTKTFTDGTVNQPYNKTFQDFKDLAAGGTADQILNNFVDILIGNWVNGALDFFNDLFADENNKITKELPLVQGLLQALGGFGEKSIITDLVNGLFQLKRSDKASFSLTQREKTNFVGFSNESGFFLLSNIQFNKNGAERGIVPVILGLVNGKNKNTGYKVGNVLHSNAPLLANSKKSAAGTDYSKLLTKENTKAAQELIDTLDELLSSLLANTSLNGFDWDSTDNILSSLVTFASAYLGGKNTSEIVKLLNNYLFFITGESYAKPSSKGKIGTAPTKNGDVDKKKVYTSANLSNLVIQTYSLLENIIDYLFYNNDTGFLKNDTNMLIADAIYGIVSPDAVAVRLSDEYADTAKILKKKDYLNWNSFKVEITDANNAKKNWNKDYLKFGFSKGDKEAFYDALGESFNGIAAIIGVVLTNTYTDASRTKNFYSEILYPIVKNLSDATGAKGSVMTGAQFNKASDSQKLIKGIVTPVSNILATFYDAPVSMLLNLVKGIAGIAQDKNVKKIINGVLDSINNAIDGVLNVVNYLSPTFAKMLRGMIGEISIALPKKNIIVTLINNALGELFTLPNIDWNKLATAKSPAEVLLLVYGYLVDTILGSELIQSLIDSLAPGLSNILKKLSAVEILTTLNKVLAVVQSPTQVYWTFSEYAAKLTNSFVYPKGITAATANKAVDQLDSLVANVFPLLNGLGVTDIKGLGSLVNDNLYTNSILTKLATALYGALDGNATIKQVFGALSLDVSPKGIAAYLTDSSFGKTYSSAAKTLKSAKSWKSIKKIDWGFKDGSAKAQTGFVNGLAAILRPLNNVLSVFLCEGTLDMNKLQLTKLIKSLELSGKTSLGEGEYGCTLKYALKKGVLELDIRSNVKTYSNKNNVTSVFKLDIISIINDLKEKSNSDGIIDLGTNGFESAVIPILEAFMCDGIKTYKQYKSDYKKAKDNLLINILKPLLGFVDEVCEKPFDTLTAVLPNVAYFLDSNGLMQAISNLLAPITAKDGILGVLDQRGFNVDKIVKAIAGKDLGTIIADAIGLKVKLNVELTHLEKCNIQDIVVPLVNTILKKNKIDIKVPDIDFGKLASLGTVKTVKSKAKNRSGKYTTKQVDANQGQVLVTVLRYISTVLVKNASALKKLLCGIDAIKKNATIANIIKSVFNSIGAASRDDIVLAVFYLLTEETTNRYFDYRDFKYKDDYEFSYGKLDEDFCHQLAPMLDGLVGGLLEGGLTSLVSDNLYKDDIISGLATGLYKAVEGVKVGDTNLTGLLAMTDIDFSTSNVATLLTNEKYGKTYPEAAAAIKSAGSWSKVNKKALKWGVKDRDSFMNALCAVLRPVYGVLDVLLNDASLNLFDLIKLPGSDGYTSTIVPLLEAFGCYNIKTQYQYREDVFTAYDNVLLDIINPLWDKVEDILNAPIEMLADILPNLSLFFANDGLLQIVENLLTPVSALLEALKPIVDVNDVLKAAGLDVQKLLKDKVGLSISKFDIYDLSGTLAPLVGADNVVNTLNSIIGIIKIKGQPLGLELPAIDWFKLASHGEFVLDATSQAATYGSRIYVQADQDETLIAVLRFLIDTINYKGNYDVIVNLIGGLLGGSGEGLAGTINQVLGMLQGESDKVIEDLVGLLQEIAG